MRIDLHTHSTCSDGTESPRELMHAAAAAGLDVVALTDHDTTRGWAEATKAVAATGVTLVPGIEISCAYKGVSVHLLAYLIDPSAPGLVEQIERARESRVTRARRMVERLEPDTGLTYAMVEEHTNPGATIGRPHIADALVARGVVASRDQAFEHYLANNSRYHVSHYAPDPVAATALVRQAGGVAVMAHPFAHQRGRVVELEVIREMADAGLSGLEADHRDHDEQAVAQARSLAADLGLFTTGSSDYHGSGKRNRLGEYTTTPMVLEQIVAEATSGVGPIVAS